MINVDWDNTDPNIWEFAESFALAINGGSWSKDYNEAQKRGWYLVALTAIERFQPCVNFTKFVANDYVELSHDKVRLQRDDYMKRASKIVENMYKYT